MFRAVLLKLTTKNACLYNNSRCFLFDQAEKNIRGLFSDVTMRIKEEPDYDVSEIFLSLFIIG